MAELDELLKHNYDGIEEYDNDLPMWWIGLFIVTIVFAFTYTLYLHAGPGLDQHEQLALDMKQLEELRSKVESAKPKSQLSDEMLLALLVDQKALANGAEVYKGKCLACHADKGQGLVGPNLTDDSWVHGGTPLEIHSTIVNGVVAKGMLAWKGVISDEEINNVTAYVMSLRGSNPAGAKAAEGEVVTGQKY